MGNGYSRVFAIYAMTLCIQSSKRNPVYQNGLGKYVLSEPRDRQNQTDMAAKLFSIPRKYGNKMAPGACAGYISF